MPLKHRKTPGKQLNQQLKASYPRIRFYDSSNTQIITTFPRSVTLLTTVSVPAVNTVTQISIQRYYKLNPNSFKNPKTPSFSLYDRYI